MRGSFLWLTAVAACGGSNGGSGDDAHIVKDAMPDSRFDAGPICIGDPSFTGGALCVNPPAQPLDITADMQLDTSTACTVHIAQSSGRMLCVIAAPAINVEAGATLSVTGSDPLVLWASETISIRGTLDIASSHTGDVRGAGGDDGACVTTTVDGSNAANAGGGGAGGSFGTVGGRGGAGNGTAIAGGTAAAAVSGAPGVLRGGCAGGAGGDGAGGTTRAAGGHGGGAVYMLAKQSINITGTIDASGSGGHPGGTNTGGGGAGGSGGMIALHAPLLVTGGSTIIFANGGGGGGGGKSGTAGQPGSESTAPTARPAGGTGASAGTGGDGAYQANAAGGGANGASGTTGGGGGGGGGAGIIHVLSGQSLVGAISPAPI